MENRVRSASMTVASATPSSFVWLRPPQLPQEMPESGHGNRTTDTSEIRHNRHPNSAMGIEHRTGTGDKRTAIDHSFGFVKNRVGSASKTAASATPEIFVWLRPSQLPQEMPELGHGNRTTPTGNRTPDAKGDGRTHTHTRTDRIKGGQNPTR